ncbi:MAG: hypothetical protein WCP45_05525 [Verrucomicrobiota bacterium]
MTTKKSPSNQDPASKIATGGPDDAAHSVLWDPLENAADRLFTRDEIKEQILMFAVMDPQPNGKRVSNRKQSDNALLELVASSFDVSEDYGGF